ncbi:MAG: hypothetical protein AABX77_03385 [Nanoarchaeota archaeon]
MEKEFLEVNLQDFNVKKEVFESEIKFSEKSEEINIPVNENFIKENEKITEQEFNLENFINDLEKQVVDINKNAEIEDVNTEDISKPNKNLDEARDTIEKNYFLSDFFRQLDIEEVIPVLQSKEIQNLEQELENIEIIEKDEEEEKIAYSSQYTNSINAVQEFSENYWETPDYLSSMKSYDIKKTASESNYGELISYLDKEEQSNSFQKSIYSISELMIETVSEQNELMPQSISQSIIYAATRISSFERAYYDEDD